MNQVFLTGRVVYFTPTSLIMRIKETEEVPVEIVASIYENLVAAHISEGSFIGVKGVIAARGDGFGICVLANKIAILGERSVEDNDD